MGKMDGIQSEGTGAMATLDVDSLNQQCHVALVAEIGQVLKLEPAKRLELARQRRSQQLARYNHYEQLLKSNGARQITSTSRGTATEAKVGEKRKNAKRSRHIQGKAEAVKFVSCVALMDAVIRRDLDDARRELASRRQGDSINACVPSGLTVMHQACIDNFMPFIEMLITEHGMDVNVRDVDHWTPLHTAALCGHSTLASYLINCKADLLATNTDGFMPYDLCEDDTTLDVIESAMAKRGITQEMINSVRSAPEKIMLNDLQKLSREDGDLEFRGQHGETPLHVAAANGYLEVAEFLLSRLVSLDSVDYDGWQPLHCAAYWRQGPMLELLLRHGADLNAKTADNKQPIDLCPDEPLRQWLKTVKSIQETHSRKQSQSPQNVSTSSSDNNITTGQPTTVGDDRGRVTLCNVDIPATATVSRSRIDGSHTSLYSSNLSLADKSTISASVRRLSAGSTSAGPGDFSQNHDVSSNDKLRKKDVQNECEIWSSMQSLVIDDLINEQKQLQTRDDSAGAAVDISASTIIRQTQLTMTTALQNKSLSDDQCFDRTLHNDLNSLQYDADGLGAEKELFDPDASSNWEFKPRSESTRAGSLSTQTTAQQAPADKGGDQQAHSISTTNNDSIKWRVISVTSDNGSNGTSNVDRKHNTAVITNNVSENGTKGLTSSELKKQRLEQNKTDKSAGSELRNSVVLVASKPLDSTDVNATAFMSESDGINTPGRQGKKHKRHKCAIM